MAASKPSPGPDAVFCETEIAARPERVFEALTDPKQLVVWWRQEPSVETAKFEIDARTGGHWCFRWRPAPGADHGAVGELLRRNGAEEFEARGEILEYVPPRLLVWSWIANWHEHPTQPTVVRWELAPIPAGTRVRVTHSVLKNEPTVRKDYGSGWIGVLRLLKIFAEN